MVALRKRSLSEIYKELNRLHVDLTLIQNDIAQLDRQRDEILNKEWDYYADKYQKQYNRDIEHTFDEI